MQQTREQINDNQAIQINIDTWRRHLYHRGHCMETVQLYTLTAGDDLQLTAVMQCVVFKNCKYHISQQGE